MLQNFATVEVNNVGFTDGGTADADAARVAEVAAIRADTTLSPADREQQIDTIYQRLAGGTTLPAPVAEREWDPAIFGPHAAEAYRVEDAAVRDALGADYDASMADAGAAVREILPNHSSEFLVFSKIVRGKGPKAVAAAVKFLASLQRL